MSAQSHQSGVAPLALCPACGEPLISTIVFSGYEFVCVCCGMRVDFLGPRRGDGSDPALLARYDELKAEWDEHARGLLPRSRFWRDDCERCSFGGEDHWQHATDEERAADERGRAWLKERVS